MTQRIAELLIATRNPGKVWEVSEKLNGLPLRLLYLADFPAVQAASETGVTYLENAIIKARSYAVQSHCWTLADDSGLEVAALGGAPGPLSARYAGANASDAERIERLLQELDRTQDPHRRARFVCAIALADGAGNIAGTFTGTCEGSIARAPRGSHGFGYDPIFIPDGYDKTFGELSAEIKQRISHRARALEQFAQSLAGGACLA